MSVRDGRRNPALLVTRDELAILAERCDKRRLANARSAYLALLELAGERERLTQKALAARAGLTASMLKECLGALEALGLLRPLADGWQLATPSAADVAEAPLVVASTAPVVPPELAERVEKFFAIHAGRVEPIRGSRPQRGEAALVAAVKILRREPDSRRIVALLDFALSDRFYADKVLTLTGFEQWWPRISAAYRADALRRERGPGERPAPPAQAHVSYESERVQVSR